MQSNSNSDLMVSQKNWKNLNGNPSGPGAPLGSHANRAILISARVNGASKISFSWGETLSRGSQKSDWSAAYLMPSEPKIST